MQDIKNGGTPLHWAKSKDIVVALIEAGCKVDAKNFKGDPALHTMIGHGRLDCVMSLISYGANINLKDADGNTPIHIACEVGNESIGEFGKEKQHKNCEMQFYVKSIVNWM